MDSPFVSRSLGLLLVGLSCVVACEGGSADSGGTGGVVDWQTYCPTLNEDDCKADGCFEVRGYLIDDGGECFDEATSRFYGCEYQCPAQTRKAEDADGNVWQFPGGCYPDELTELPYSPVPACGEGGAPP